jgi:dTMP kinase
MQGKLIVFEGIEGSGKSTQIKLAHNWLQGVQGLGKKVVATCQPGSTALGAVLRSHLLNEQLSGITETLLFSADRHHHIEKFITPHIAKGYIVLCDRYIQSTIAYQGWGRDVDKRLINVLVENCLPADLTIWFDLPYKDAIARKNSLDAIESRGADYFDWVQRGYEDLWQRDFMNCQRVDATKSVEDVHKNVKEYIKLLLDII